MYELHAVLFEYADYLAGTEIESVLVTDGQVAVQVRGSGMKVLAARQDTRTAPLEALNFGAYEPAELRLVLSLIEPGSTVFDVGASVGWYSLCIATIFPDVQVLAFEPIPSTFATLVANVELNGCPNIAVHNLGFSDRSGTASFFLQPDLAVNASLADHRAGSTAEQVTCPVQRLDEFVDAAGVACDFIKCDVEGAELLVFQGGLATISAQRPAIFAEMLRKWSASFGYHPNQIIELLAGAGYRCFTFSGAALAEFFAMDEATVETNFLFLHNDRHAEQITKNVAARHA